MMSIWQTLEQADKLATLEINSWSSAITDPIWQIFSNIPIWVPMYVIIVAFIIQRLGWKKGLIVVAAAALTFGFCDQSSNFIKALTERLRPCHDPYMIHNGLNILESGGKFSFFSAHAANAFGLATCTTIGFRIDKRLKYKGYITWMYIWATLVAVSRIFVGKHFLGDVIVGICVGTLAGLAFGTLAKVIIKRFLS
jgi:undecaprenyl-diphosphatase